MNPKISVVIPVYQVEKFIEKTVKSLLKQNFNNFEIILINDGSKDNSIEVAKSVLLNSNIDYKIINQVNKGVSASRNLGIKNSKGDWIVCIDSDDYINMNFLNCLYSDAIKNNSEVSIVNFQYIKERSIIKAPKRKYRSRLITKKKVLNLFLTRRIKIIVPGMLIKKDFIVKNNLYYNENINFSEDQQYIWRVLLTLERCTFNKTPLYNYVVRSNSTMTSSSIDKIMTGYEGFLNFTSTLENIKPLNLIFPRWILGTLRSSAKMMPYSDFKRLSKKLNYKENTKKLIMFPELTTVLLYLILKMNLKFFYSINKKYGG